MAPSRSNAQRPPGLVRQLSLQQTPACVTPAPAPIQQVRRGLLRRQRSAEEDRPVTRLLHSALRVTASALGPGFLADPTPPPPPPPVKQGRLRPVRVAWAELRKPSASSEQTDTVSVVAQRVGISKPNTNHNARPPTCLPALARANLDIFLAHSGLAQCLASAVLSDPPTPAPISDRDRPMTPALLSPRDPIKPLPMPSKTPATPQLSASARRVNFRNTAFRAINRSLSDSSTPELRPPEQKNGRVLSAPAHRPTPLVAPPRPMLRSLPRRGPLQSSFDNGDRVPEQLTLPAERNVRSAPPRRRLKAGGRKKGGGRRGEESSGDDEIEEVPVPQRASSAGTKGRRGLRIGAEIVTMVSLVSPAGSSDSEDERSPRPVVSPSRPSTPADVKPHVAPTDIVCARKITKSVSFQARGVIPGLLRRTSSTLALPFTPTSNEVSSTPPASSSAQGSQKELPTPSPPTCSPPQQQDCRIRRKLLRTKAVQRNDSESVLKTVSNAESICPAPEATAGELTRFGELQVTPKTPAPSPVTQRPEIQDSSIPQLEEKPQFETPKEQECWHLYRKMCEKGLTVSFDTVLRGMLTPTEYRLRRGALLSTC